MNPMVQDGSLYVAAFLEDDGHGNMVPAVHYIGGASCLANAKASFWSAYRGKKVKLCEIGLAVGARVAQPLIKL